MLKWRNVLYGHPDILECAVVGVPDPKWGEVPKAFITPRPGANLSAEEIVNFCRENMARFKVPKSIEFAICLRLQPGKS